MEYLINYQTLHGNILTFVVDDFKIVDKVHIEFVDKKTGRKRRYPLERTEIEEIKNDKRI